MERREEKRREEKRRELRSEEERREDKRREEEKKRRDEKRRERPAVKLQCCPSVYLRGLLGSSWGSPEPSWSPLTPASLSDGIFRKPPQPTLCKAFLHLCKVFFCKFSLVRLGPNLASKRPPLGPPLAGQIGSRLGQDASSGLIW